MLWPTDRRLFSRVFLSREGEVRTVWGWFVVAVGGGLLLTALLEIVTLLLALQGISILPFVLGPQMVLWLSRHLL